jgi:lipoate-protein ligase A
MAVDEALLESALSRDVCTLRFYGWSEPTVSCGYFQKPAEALAESDFKSLPVVRRLSGGGAILHHHELTYSVAIPKSHDLARQPYQLYGEVHRAMIDVLAKRGVDASLRGDTPGETADHFLCFARSDPNDVLLGGHKILGSAQRRRRGAILQHGSLVLRVSPYAPQFPGLFDLTSTTIPEKTLCEKTLCEKTLCEELANAVGRRLAATCVTATLSSNEVGRAGKIAVTDSLGYHGG